VFVSGKDADNTATDNTAIIGIAVGVSVGLLCIAAVIIVIAVLIYRGYKLKHRYNEFLMNFGRTSPRGIIKTLTYIIWVGVHCVVI